MEIKKLTAERFVDSVTGCSYRYVHSETEYFRPHYHDYFEIFVLLEGEVVHYVNGKHLPLHKGALVFIRPADVHDYMLREKKRFSMLNITFTKETAEQLFTYLGGGFGVQRLLGSKLPPEIQLTDAELSYIISQMTGIRTIDESDYDRIKTALRVLLFRIFTRFFADYRDIEKEKKPEWITELCDIMRKDGNFIKGTQRMLELSGKSREHLSRCIKKYMGVTLSEFVNELRLNFIANMLKNSNHEIANIVFESGFGNLSWAAEQFRKKFGVTMSEYRKRQ